MVAFSGEGRTSGDGWLVLMVRVLGVLGQYHLTSESGVASAAVAL